jgi:hypothetical protein
MYGLLHLPHSESLSSVDSLENSDDSLQNSYDLGEFWCFALCLPDPDPLTSFNVSSSVLCENLGDLLPKK